MTRAEYMEELAQALKAYDEDFALDIIGDYRRHFDDDGYLRNQSSGRWFTGCARSKTEAVR